MRRTDDGFTLIEVLVVIAILATIAGMVAVLVGPSHREKNKLVCIEHVRTLTGLIDSSRQGRYPVDGGASFVLYLVQRGELEGSDALAKLFCPGDSRESLEVAGGESAYGGLDLGRRDHGHLTSYAGRAQDQEKCRVGSIPGRPTVLIADDSEDHHDGRGFVVGLSGGAAKFRDKVDFYKLDRDTPLEIGEGSAAEELRCLSAE